jgi:hypothetical protein
LIAVNVERHADVVEKASFQELDVPFGQDGKIGLQGIHVFEFGPEDVLLNQIYLLIKPKRDQERLAAVPDEVYSLDRQLIDTAFDVLERRLYLIEIHAGFVAEIGKFVAIIAAEIAIFGDLEHKLRRRVNSHCLHCSTD